MHRYSDSIWECPAVEMTIEAQFHSTTHSLPLQRSALLSFHTDTAAVVWLLLLLFINVVVGQFPAQPEHR